MTLELLNKIIEENNITKDVHLMSDSGWECCKSEMNGIYYNRKENTLIFTQCGCRWETWFEEDDWELLYGYNKLCKDCRYYDKYGDCIKRTTINGKVFYVGIHDVSDCELYERKEKICEKR